MVVIFTLANVKSVRYNLLRAFPENLQQLSFNIEDYTEVRSDLCNLVWNVTSRRTFTQI